MSTIVTRAGKGSPLTHAEVDANFTNLNTDKLEVGAAFNSAVAATPAVAANTAKVTNATHTGDVTGATALTIAANAVDNTKLADMAANAVKVRAAATTGDPSDLALAASQLLGRGDTGDIAPITLGANLSMTGTTLSATGGGGSPGGASGEIQFNNAGVFGGAADVEIEGGQLRLPSIATPATPAAGGGKLYGKNLAGLPMPAFLAPAGVENFVQPYLGRGRFAQAFSPGNNASMQTVGLIIASVGTATAANVGTSNRHARMARTEYLVTVAAATAVTGFRSNNLQWTLGAATAGDGGFLMSYTWGPAIGVATTTTRAFAGVRGSVAAPTDVEPSTLTNIGGMGWDAADTNIQFMHNDGAGTATKINLGASFPVPTVDRQSVYRITLYAPPGTTQRLGYWIEDLVSGAVATGTVTTDLPSTATLLAPYNYFSVGGTSSVIGIAIMGLTIWSDF
jgi:hypothetical protein